MKNLYNSPYLVHNDEQFIKNFIHWQVVNRKNIKLDGYNFY